MNQVLLLFFLYALCFVNGSLCQVEIHDARSSDYYQNLKTEKKFHYPLIVISLDGVRADLFEKYLKQTPNSSFHTIINTGVKADYMIPSFPTVTFPNYYSIVTGLYPESHGIVNNYFYDPDEDEKVNFITDDIKSFDVKWWNKADPIWLTARKQNLKTFGSYWPGISITNRSTDFWLIYDSSYLKTFIELYDINQRIIDTVNVITKMKIDLTLFYTSQPDSAGHVYGPNSTNYQLQFQRNDVFIKTLINSLKEADEYETTNIIILSDHGMTETKANCAIKIIDYGLDNTLIDLNKTVFGVISLVYATPGNKQLVYDKLSKIPNLSIHSKNTIPDRLHFNKSHRIAEIIVISDEGYMLTYNSTCMKGDHGYDNALPSMRTIFMARGPNFAQNETFRSFENVDVYPLICELLKLKCNPNNGTLRTFEDILIDATSSATRYNLSSILIYLILFYQSILKNS